MLSEYGGEVNKRVLAEAEARYEKAIVEYRLARGAYMHALGQMAWALVCEKSLFPPVRVVIDFEGGPETVILEEIVFSSETPVVVRHLTKRGKPHKSKTYYAWSILAHATAAGE